MSGQISLLNQNGSSVLLGNVLMIPVANALLYVQPLYVESSRNPFPVLQRVIAVYGNQPAAIGNSLSSALTQLFAAPVQASPTTGRLVDDPVADRPRRCWPRPRHAYTQSQADLKAGNLGAYQTDITSMESYLQQVQALTGGPVASTTTTTTTNPGQAAIAGLNS